jgi:hypothetical protein
VPETILDESILAFDEIYILSNRHLKSNIYVIIINSIDRLPLPISYCYQSKCQKTPKTGSQIRIANVFRSIAGDSMAASEMVRIPNELIDPIKKVVALWRSGEADKVKDAINQIASGASVSAELSPDILPLVQRMTGALETIAANSVPDIASRERLVSLYNLNLTQLENQSRSGGNLTLDMLIAQVTGWRSLGNGSFVRPVN